MTDRRLPYNLQAEEALLGAMLFRVDAIEVAQNLVADDFYKPSHGRIFSAIQVLYERNETVDVVSVYDYLERNKLTDHIGGVPALVELQNNTPALSNAAKYAKIISDHAMLRKIARAGMEISEIGFDAPEDVSLALAQVECLVAGLDSSRRTDGTQSATDLLSATLERLQMLQTLNGKLLGTPSGFSKVDDLLAGFQNDFLYVVGARPSMGKTAFALDIAAHATISENLPVLFFSLEMGAQELLQRMLCSRGAIDSRRFKDGKLDTSDWPKLQHALESLQGAPLWIDDNPMITVAEIRSKARKMQAQVGDLGLIVVDYLQLMGGGRGNRQEEVAAISRSLKIAAKELHAPVMALSQLSRNLESRNDKRPILSDLRESGGIEQDADVVMFLYRDDRYNEESEWPSTAELIVAKHRNGPLGMTRLGFVGQHTKFLDLA